MTTSVESNHPPSYDLDAWTIGEATDAVKAHVSSCASCKDYLTALREELGAESLPPFVSSVPSKRVVPIRRVAWTLVVALPMAAALFFVLRPTKPPASGSVALGGSNATSSPSMAIISAARERDRLASEAMRFKGGVTMTSIIDRGGRQERRTGDVALSEGNRMRIEVAVDRAGPLTVAFFGDDGSFLPLLGPEWVEAGTHLTDASLGFDRSGGSGLVVCGPADAVATARQTKTLSGLLSLRVRYVPGAGEVQK